MSNCLSAELAKILPSIYACLLRSSRFFSYLLIINDVTRDFISWSVINFVLFCTLHFEPLTFVSWKAAMTSSGYRIPSNQTLAQICFDCYCYCYLLIPLQIRLNLKYSHRDEIKKEYIYSNVTGFIPVLEK